MAQKKRKTPSRKRKSASSQRSDPNSPSTETKGGGKSKSGGDARLAPLAEFVVTCDWKEGDGAADQWTAERIGPRQRKEQGDIQRICRWMVEQVAHVREQQGKPEPEVERGAAATPAPVTLEITAIRVSQPPDAHKPLVAIKPGQACQGVLGGGEAFALSVAFDVRGPGVEEAAQRRMTYDAHFYAYNWSTGTKTHLGDTAPDRLTEGRQTYTATLSEVTLEPGMYRLECFTTLHGAPAPEHRVDLPLVHVA